MKANDRILGRKMRSSVGWDPAPWGQRQERPGAAGRPERPDAPSLSAVPTPAARAACVSRSCSAFPNSRGPARLPRSVSSSLTGAASRVPFVRLPKGPFLAPPGSHVCLSSAPSRKHPEVRPGAPGPTATSVFTAWNPPVPFTWSGRHRRCPGLSRATSHCPPRTSPFSTWHQPGTITPPLLYILARLPRRPASTRSTSKPHRTSPCPHSCLERPLLTRQLWPPGGSDGPMGPGRFLSLSRKR